MVRAMRGYFALGTESLSKAHNAGALIRTAHAFGASFFFAIDPALDFNLARQTDTADSCGHLPLYQYPDPASLQLPRGCALVGVEMTDDAISLPSFRHPFMAAYVLGRERGNLSDALLARCDHVVQIPTAFCVNVSVAGAIVLYDRMISLGRFAERPVRSGGPIQDLPEHVQGGQIFRSKKPA